MKQIQTIHLFPELTEKLLELLKELKTEDWDTPSPIKGRTVKDLVSHLIDSALRRLSIQRDNYTDKSVNINIQSYSDLVNYIQKLNSDWMLSTRRLSPDILIDMFEYASNKLHEFLLKLDPNAKAIFSVAWAGEEESKNWFDIAREYTEIWHHHMQIRIAVNKPLLMDIRYIESLYDTFMLALPHHYRDMTDYSEGELLKVIISGNLNKSWMIMKEKAGWILTENNKIEVNNTVHISADDAWMIFTNTDRNKEKYRSKITITGDKKLGVSILDMVTVMS